MSDCVVCQHRLVVGVGVCRLCKRLTKRQVKNRLAKICSDTEKHIISDEDYLFRVREMSKVFGGFAPLGCGSCGETLGSDFTCWNCDFSLLDDERRGVVANCGVKHPLADTYLSLPQIADEAFEDFKASWADHDSSFVSIIGSGASVTAMAGGPGGECVFVGSPGESVGRYRDADGKIWFERDGHWSPDFVKPKVKGGVLSPKVDAILSRNQVSPSSPWYETVGKNRVKVHFPDDPDF